MPSRCLGTTPKEDWWENLGSGGDSFIDHWTLGCMIESLDDKSSTISMIAGFPFRFDIYIYRVYISRKPHYHDCGWFIVHFHSNIYDFPCGIAGSQFSVRVETNGGIGRSWGWCYRLGWLDAQNIVLDENCLNNIYRINRSVSWCWWLAWGVVKKHLPSSSFLDCAAATPPLNSLFKDVDSTKVTYSNLDTYLDLILALFDVSPEGC